jgi:hypothetical protein
MGLFIEEEALNLVCRKQSKCNKKVFFLLFFFWLPSELWVQVSFTNLHDNVADGTFRCLLSSGSKKLNITRGEFHNLKIYKKFEDWQY